MSVDRRAALGAAAAGLLAAAVPARSQPGGDTQALQRLLGLELRLRSTYETASRRRVVDGELADLLAGHEGEHAGGLERALKRNAGGGTVGTVPSPELTRALAGGRTAFLRFALRAESEAVAAYADAVAGLRDPKLLQPLGSVMASHAQHLVLLRDSLGERVLTRPFEPAGQRPSGTPSG